MKATKRLMLMVMLAALCVSMLTGCDSATPPVEEPQTTEAAAQLDQPAELTDEQRNSIAMLNYLTVLTQEIHASKNSRLYLESVYASLLNNTYPNAVDGETLFQLNDMLDSLERFRMTAVKRERLEYVYEQNRAQALRAAVPSPLGLMSAVKSFRLSSLLASVAYMAIDSASSYSAASGQAQMQYLQDGWALDDEEAASLHQMRANAFNYMVSMVNAYDLPGELALTEQAVADFVTWKNESNVVRRVQLLEANRGVYQGFGSYWLVLADSYYAKGDAAKCLEAVAEYEALGSRIFRKDYEYARALPVAILAAEEALPAEAYPAEAERWLQAILTNTDYTDWGLRYFAAQTYIDLYARTGEERHLQSAYEIALNNATVLVRDQLTRNAEYLAEVQPAPIPKDATKKQQEEIKSYNKQLAEERKTALPPVSDALLLNCELLFALAKQLDVPQSEMSKIDDILHEKGAPAFLVAPLDTLYWFTGAVGAPDAAALAVNYRKEDFTLPALCVSEDARVTVTVTGAEGEAVYEDWALARVERKQAGELSGFTAVYASPSAQKHAYKPGDVVRVEVQPKAESNAAPYVFEFAVTETKTLGILPGIGFDRVK